MNDDGATPDRGSDQFFLFLSTHDFRSKRKANVHFIMQELAKRGRARFFSLGYSVLSLLKRDPRASLWSAANRIENFGGVECYLWRSWLHPVNLRHPRLRALERRGFDFFRDSLPPVFARWVGQATTIIIESGLPVITVELLKEINPAAKLIYLCSDALETIGCSPYLSEQLRRVAPAFDGIRVPSAQLVSEFPKNVSLYYVPHGMNPISATRSESPYTGGTHLVTVGSMLFDRTFFDLAAKAFPNLTFHVIGGGKQALGLAKSNIKVYGEMPFADTLPYLAHAHAGIAPYVGNKVSSYLADTSMKLMQYGAYGLPAVCPIAAAGNKRGRFGYRPGDKGSIVGAIESALQFGRFAGDSPLTWAEVTTRILYPHDYPDTHL